VNVMGALYDLTVPSDTSRKWDFKGYTPDAIVVSLGTNDFIKGTPPKTEFNAAYRKLIEQALEHAPKAHVFCTSSAMAPDDETTATLKGYLTELIADLAKDGKKNIHYVQFPL